MDAQVHIKTVNIDYREVKYNIYVAKNLDDANEYIAKHGGIIFHDIGLNKLVVMPQSIKGFSGQLDMPMSED